MGTITLSINAFIPKPATPFQWAGLADDTTLKNRMDLIRQGLKKISNVTVNLPSLKTAKISALLSLGDRNTADVIESAYDRGWGMRCGIMPDSAGKPFIWKNRCQMCQRRLVLTSVTVKRFCPGFFWIQASPSSFWQKNGTGPKWKNNPRTAP